MVRQFAYCSLALARPVSTDEWKTLRMLYRFHGEVHIKLGPV